MITIFLVGIGYGMIPRGEVGLVFAAFALTQGIFVTEMYPAALPGPETEGVN